MQFQRRLQALVKVKSMIRALHIDSHQLEPKIICLVRNYALLSTLAEDCIALSCLNTRSLTFSASVSWFRVITFSYSASCPISTCLRAATPLRPCPPVSIYLNKHYSIESLWSIMYRGLLNPLTLAHCIIVTAPGSGVWELGSWGCGARACQYLPTT